ncbi:MAG TPA: tetratricopeptide repeat protein, partial [Pirellulaceae bacterium]|nr:tetratricopeptide repeat protein [Pirellulaceae bacterium]
DPRSRYASAADLAAELTRFVENKPITARRPSLRQRLAKWSARNSTLVTTVAVAMLAFATIVGGILGWWSRDNAAQHLVIERVATEALQSAEQFGKQANWPQSLSELKRAEAAFAAHPIRSALLSQIQAGQKDVAMALRLDEIRLQAAMVAGSDFDFSSADAAYQAAFDAYGIPVAKLSPAEAAREVRASQIREELAAALTDWSIVRMRMNGKRTADSHLLNVARQADPDPWRGRLRKEWKRDELIEMATSPALEKQSPATLFLFVTAAMHQRANDEPMQTKLRQIQRLHTNDFWLNFALARYFENTEPPQWDEAVRYYSVTLGLRPDAAAAHNNVGVALHKQGRRSEAIAEYRRAIELQPEFTAPRLNLGLAVADEPQVRPAAD